MGSAHISFVSPLGKKGIYVLLQGSSKYLIVPIPDKSGRDHPPKPSGSIAVSKD